MNVLVTGASGFAGSHLVEELLKNPEYTVFGTAFGSSQFLSTLLPKEHILTVDLTNRQAVFDLIQKIQPEQIFHLAAFAYVGQSFEKADEVLLNNIGLQVSMLRAMQTFAPKARLLSIGSAEEYGLSEGQELPINELHPFRPTTPYAVSKIAQDMLSYAYAVSNDLNIVRVRPFNHIGERQSPDFAVSAFAKQIVAIERGEQTDLKVGRLDAVRDFTDVKDVVKAYILLMQKGNQSEVYNVGSGRGVQIQSIIDMLCGKAKVPVIVHEDKQRVRSFDVPSIIADISKISALGWAPQITLEESLVRVLEYWRGL